MIYMNKKTLKNKYSKPELEIHGDLNKITGFTGPDFADGEKGS